MNARLLATAGPMKDSIFALPGGEFPIGRDPSNLLAISDLSLSRRHCLLVPDGESYKIRDLESRNGTFVNGQTVKEAALQHGDQISVGDSVFVLLTRNESEDSAGRSVEFEDSQTQATAQFRPQDVLYLQPERMLKELPTNSRVARDLNALLKISRVVHEIRDFDKLQAQILDLIFEVCPAERGAILLDAKENRFSSTFARNRVSAATQPVKVSRTIARKALDEGVAVLGVNVSGDRSLSSVESLVVSNVRSLLCVPLTVFQKVIGCVYLDTSNATTRFDEDDLQLVAAIAGISAVALENARHMQWLEQENLRLATEINLDHNMIGDSPRMKEIYSFLARVAPTDATVLIQGESGTGKELVARALHRNSARGNRPFVAINCAAIPEGLLESELFGHERGSFTGALTQKKGRLEVADGGVVFLDEIGDMSPTLQVKLLRVLQEREFERLGGTHPISVDVRVIAATNKNLEAAVESSEFRRDLYYRLNVLSMRMPALRERREDIPLLARHFAAKYSKKFGMRQKLISDDAIACLMNFDWPGNVRELENAIERALVLSATDTIGVEDLPESVLEKDPPPGVVVASYHMAVKELKKQLIVNAIAEAKGNLTEAAHLLGVHPNYLHRLIRNLNLRDSLRFLPGTRSNGRGDTHS